MRFPNSEGSWLQRLALSFALLLVVAPLAACAGAGDGSAANEQAEGAAMDHAEGNDMDHGEGDMAAMDHEEGLDHTHPAGEGIPSRAEEEERDQYSKPLEVYAFGDIGEGDTVVDIGASTGYNTYLLSQVVGDTGTVYAVGANEGLEARLAEGDMAGTTNVIIPENAAAVPDGVADHVLMVREYHRAGPYREVLAELSRMLKPGGRVTIVEVRSGDRGTYLDDIHRHGEDVVIAQFAEGGFELVGESDILRRDDDDYSAYGGPTGVRYITDRMLLSFRKAQ